MAKRPCGEAGSNEPARVVRAVAALGSTIQLRPIRVLPQARSLYGRDMSIDADSRSASEPQLRTRQPRRARPPACPIGARSRQRDENRNGSSVRTASHFSAPGSTRSCRFPSLNRARIPRACRWTACLTRPRTCSTVATAEPPGVESAREVRSRGPPPRFLTVSTALGHAKSRSPR